VRALIDDAQAYAEPLAQVRKRQTRGARTGDQELNGVADARESSGEWLRMLALAQIHSVGRRRFVRAGSQPERECAKNVNRP
jgi:hypothetical protein